MPVIVQHRVGTIGTRISPEQHSMLHRQWSRFDRQPDRAADQIAVAQGVVGNVFELLKIGAITHHGHFIHAIHHGVGQRAPADGQRREPKGDDHRKTGTPTDDFLQDIDTFHVSTRP